MLYNSLPDKFEIIKKDLRSDINIQIFREEVPKNKQKIKYLPNGRLFVGCYPNKFFIFENTLNTEIVDFVRAVSVPPFSNIFALCSNLFISSVE